jgi:O-methyltransferase
VSRSPLAGVRHGGRVGTLPLVWRKLVNRAITPTGYRITAIKPPPPPPPPPKSREERIRRFHDTEARATMHAVQDWTMTSYARIFALVVATRFVADHEVAGDVVECGVWRGGSMQAVARTLLERGVSDRELHLFDTFEGMPPPTTEDRRIKGPPASELLAGRPRTENIWAVADLDDVRAGMATTGYPAERIHYHPGLVQDTIPRDAPERIALLRLDTDWYASTRHELDHLYDRLVPGGVLIIDDYDYWEGSRQATDEFLAASGARLLLVPVDTARVAVKP